MTTLCFMLNFNNNDLLSGKFGPKNWVWEELAGSKFVHLKFARKSSLLKLCKFFVLILCDWLGGGGGGGHFPQSGRV